VAVGHSVDAAVWRRVLQDALARVGRWFARSETRGTVSQFVAGLLGPVERKNGWWLAEHAGHVSPDRMQRLLRTAVWDERGVQADLARFVVDQLGAGDAVLVIDETGYLKKGVCSVGVQRQYSGTAGRVENSQIGVFLGYACAAGRALLDVRLYLPRSWVADPGRCAAAGIPADIEFATKPQLAWQMIAAALRAGITAAMVTGDEAYGLEPLLRAGLRELGLGYVLAIARNQHIQATTTIRLRADDLAVNLDELAWERRSAGAGSKGERFYDWAWIHDHTTGDDAGVHSLLVRRSISTGELAFYRCWTPHPVPLSRLITVAGRRWAIEEAFQQAKTHVGLDHYQCRGWRAWHRITILAMLALAILVATAAAHRDRHPTDNTLVPLSIGELRRLTANPSPTAIRWSTWRRHHQATARHSHHRRRSDPATST
jgi:SRSO17 transposase